MKQATVPVLGFAAFSGVGKTTLLKQLIPRLRERGLRIGLIKLSHHRFEVDVPGKDSYELRHAGAEQVLLTSSHRWALMTELPQPVEPQLSSMLQHLDQQALDLILVEGFRHEPFAKIELHRPELGHPLLFPEDPHIIAVACNQPLTLPLPRLALDDIEAMAGFVWRWLGH